MANPTQPTPAVDPDVLTITRVRPRAAVAGTWVTGRLRGYCFEALVFPEHADNPEWEIGRSRISKLWIARRAGGPAAFNWDRGPDVPAVDAEVEMIVNHLVACLAARVFG